MPVIIPGTETFTNGGIERPKSGDKGNEDVFAILETFMERMATHSHSGADSSTINLNFEKETQVFTSLTGLTWTDLGEGTYRTSLALPVGVTKTFDQLDRFFYLSRDGGTTYQRFYPNVEKIDDSNYYVFSNDNTIDIKVVLI